MMKTYRVLLPLLLACNALCAQSCQDTMPHQEIDWEYKHISEGVVLKSAVTNYLNSFQAIYIVEIDTARADFEFFVGVPGGRVTTSRIADSCGAVAAINGTFFNMAEGYNTHFISMNDSVISTTDEKEFAIRATGVFTASGEAADITYWNREKENAGATEENYAMVSGPLLIDDGADMTLVDNPFITARHPRSFVATTLNGNILFVAVDGRQPGYAEGMNLLELRTLAHSLGCVDALNLDGGGSTTLYVRGEGTDGVVNKPSGAVERTVASIIYVTVH